jgi:hypothetical protein
VQKTGERRPGGSKDAGRQQEMVLQPDAAEIDWAWIKRNH